jgi:uncharacterized protein (TIGR01777 family)
MPTVTITGGTGLVGTALGQALERKGYRVIILGRNKKGGMAENQAHWNPETGEIDKKAISDADYIIHLAGANVGEKRWTEKRKQEIVNSRVKSGELICKSLVEIPNQVRAVISASAIGWYGPDKNDGHPFEESGPSYHDFLGTTCRQWENSIQPVTAMGKRLVIFRAGIVLSKNGGALKEFIKPLYAGVATVLGTGRQVVSWIHSDDLVRLYIYALENEQLEGIYNAVSSVPVSNKELVSALAKAKQNFSIPVKVPSSVLKIVLGEMSIEVLKSATVSNKKIRQAGFQFDYNNIQDAFTQLFDQKKQDQS